jgi:4-nitrophenyl phosphatase
MAIIPEPTSEQCSRIGGLRGFLVDMDGVIYRGKQVIAGAPEALRRMRERGRLLMLTNNSTKESEPLAAWLRERGFDLAAEDLLIITEIAEHWLCVHHATDRLLVIGEDHFLARLRRAGLELVTPAQWREADVVVIACDLRADHDKLGAALNALKNGAEFIATNPDMTVQGDDGVRLEAGAYASMLAQLSGRAPLVLGKPEAICYRYALDRLGLPAEQVAMVGDNLDTDISGARANGLFGVLVLTGLTGQPSPLADLTVPDIARFAGLL